MHLHFPNPLCSSFCTADVQTQTLIRKALLCFPAGGGQLLIIYPWSDWQGWNLDDWLWKDCAHAAPSHPGPSQPVGGGQQRGRVPLGPGQFHWHSDQHASGEMKGIVDLQNCHFLHRLSDFPVFVSTWRIDEGRREWTDGMDWLVSTFTTSPTDEHLSLWIYLLKPLTMWLFSLLLKSFLHCK